MTWCLLILRELRHKMKQLLLEVLARHCKVKALALHVCAYSDVTIQRTSVRKR